jgi:hypothetical protein
MLCNRCQDLFEGTLDCAEKYNQDIWTLETLSRDRNCFICHRILQTLQWKKEISRDLPVDTNFKIYRTVFLCKDFGFVYIYVSLTDSRSRDAVVFQLRPVSESLLESTYFPSHCSMIETECESASEIHNQIKNIPECTGSDRTLELALRWLRDCRANHQQCIVSRKEAKPPMRLLELDQPEENHIRVRNTSSVKEVPSYMTLSHCWGTAQFLKLEKETIQQMYDGVEINCLPKTFQHATYVARKLGAHYLWIDSLCILQDSKEDWASESSVMGEIYKGSICNIAATVSASSNDGFLFKRHVRQNRPCIIKTKYTVTGNARFSNRELHLEVDNWSGLPHENDQPLFRRGCDSRALFSSSSSSFR